MPNFVWIHPVVWAPNQNKQTDRHTSLLYAHGRSRSIYSFKQRLNSFWGKTTKAAIIQKVLIVFVFR